MRDSEILHLRWRDITLPEQAGDYGLILLNRTQNGERRGAKGNQTRAMGGATAPEIAEIPGNMALNMVKRYAHFGKDRIASVRIRVNAARLGDSDMLSTGAIYAIRFKNPQKSP